MRKHLKKILFILISFFILSGFTYYFTANQYWYQQTMPDLGNMQLRDFMFKDSLVGYSTALRTNPNNGRVLKTTSGGDNWNIIFQKDGAVINAINFLDKDFGYLVSSDDTLYKTTNGGNNWSAIYLNIYVSRLNVLNKDTIWTTSSSDFGGGVYISINGGVNWISKYDAFAGNPDRIYFFNATTGFIARDNTINSYLRKTTNGGNNWTLISGATGFGEMHFTDSLTGWKNVSGNLEKTTNGGLNWVRVFNLTFGNGSHEMADFKVLNKDTIWGTGGYILFPNSRTGSLVYKSTNGGINWTYQIPDTTIRVGTFQLIDFVNKNYGWCYSAINKKGIHTKVGGEPIEYPVSISNLSSEIPNNFKLYQNYPNPFNPTTTISYEFQTANEVKLTVFDINGKEVEKLVNQKQKAGSYSVTFNALNLASGVYFYILQIENARETKKMLFVK